ncbi:MAG: hypothetical protein G8345_07810, partial [Magnetococcales bacterium]|nr:hypothetical protein [Magnetococcales bacterium]
KADTISFQALATPSMAMLSMAKIAQELVSAKARALSLIHGMDAGVAKRAASTSSEETVIHIDLSEEWN